MLLNNKKFHPKTTALEMAAQMIRQDPLQGEYVAKDQRDLKKSEVQKANYTLGYGDKSKLNFESLCFAEMPKESYQQEFTRQVHELK
jgi:hypothetical protein